MRIEHRVAGREHVLGQALRLEAGAQVGRRDLFAGVEHAALQGLNVEQNARREEDRRVLDAEPGQPIGRPDVGERRAVVEADVAVVRLVADLAAEMAERIHVGADLADFGREELVVPDGPAAPAFGTAGRAAGHAKAEDPAGR